MSSPTRGLQLFITNKACAMLPMLPMHAATNPCCCNGRVCPVGGPASAVAAAAAATVDNPAALAAAYVQRFNLNPDQAAVLHHCASWFKRPGAGPCASDGCGAEPAAGAGTASDRDLMGRSEAPAAPDVQPPVCLIHGPFGSGDRGDDWNGMCRLPAH